VTHRSIQTMQFTHLCFKTEQ